MKTILFEKISERLNNGPLPGKEAQYRMAHVVRQSYTPPPSHARKAGVLALFYPGENEWEMVFIERGSRNPNDRHKGQISFPGGKFEKEDEDMLATALRETEEEIGVPASDIQALGALSQLYIPVSNFLVFPFVGTVDYKPEFVLQVEEVQDIVQTPFSLLQQPDTVKTTDLQISENITLQRVPFFDIQGKILWGATAMILSELLQVIDHTMSEE